MKTYIASILVCVVFAFITQTSLAQNANPTVNGTVVMAIDDSPLPGVNIIIAGTNLGTTTDAEGKFRMPTGLKVGDKLVFTYLGYTSQTHVVTNAPHEDIMIRLKEDAIMFFDEIASNDHYSVKSRRGVMNVFRRNK